MNISVPSCTWEMAANSSRTFSVFQYVVVVPVTAASVLLNSCLLVALCCSRRTSYRSSNQLVLSMTAADLLCTLSISLPAIASKTPGIDLCLLPQPWKNVLCFLQGWSNLASLNSLAGLSLCRMIPLKYPALQSKRLLSCSNCKKTILGLWLWAFLNVMPCVPGSAISCQIHPETLTIIPQLQGWRQQLVMFVTYILGSLPPTLVITYCTVCIIRCIKQLHISQRDHELTIVTRRTRVYDKEEHNISKLFSSYRLAARNVLFICLAYLINTSPVMIVAICYNVTGLFIPWLAFIAVWMIVVNCIVNSVLYLCLNKSLWRELCHRVNLINKLPQGI